MRQLTRRSFWAPATYALLEAVAARLLPQPERGSQAHSAGPRPRPTPGRRPRRRLWRYDALPPDREAFRLGLGGIEQIAQARFKADFRALKAEPQNEVLRALASGNPPGEAWETLNAGRFFEELLAELTETYYAHPLAQDEIGYVGYADLPNWTKIGLNEREEREN